jgi:hypothetical protein
LIVAVATAPQAEPRRIDYVRPVLTPYQERALFNAARYAVVEATTKAGKTVGCMAWLVEQAVNGHAGRNYWWVAPILDQARIPFERIRRGLPRELYTANEQRLTLTLANGTVLWFKSADNPDSLYGEDVYAAVIDEASRDARRNPGTRCAPRSPPPAAPFRIIGNVKGRKNWAYHLARKAEAGEPGMAYAKITAHDAVAAGILDQAEVEDARRQLPDAVFRELYLAEPSDDQGNPFGLDAIRARVAPLHPDCAPDVWGWDLAKSTDWTVGVALCTHGATCRFERFQKSWQDTIRDIGIVAAGTPALVDSTGVGDPVLEALQKLPGMQAEGYKFSAPSKQQLMEGLAVAIQQGEVSYPDGPIRAELEAFEYVYTRSGVHYSAPAGMHDDCVCAFALAVAKRSHKQEAWFV